MVRISQRSFASGELDDSLSGAADTSVYNRGCRQLQQGIVTQRGTAKKRWGSKYVAEAHGGASHSKVWGMNIPGVGARVVECANDGRNFRFFDASDESVEDASPQGDF